MKLSKNVIKKKVEYFSKLLGVSDYSIYIHLTNAKRIWDDEYNSYAKVGVDDDSREACISLNKKLLSKHPKELDKTLIHELLHVRFNELFSLIRLILKLYVKDKKAKKVYAQQLEQLEHKIIVPIADSLADTFKHSCCYEDK